MKSFLIKITLLLPFLLLFTSEAKAQSKFSRQREYCSLLSKCGVELTKETCPDSLRRGVKEVEYTAQRCNEVKGLIKKGVSIDNYQGQKLYGFLGQKYRVDYYIEDKLVIKQSQFEYLINDIPLAARVVNRFQDTKYFVEYLDGDARRYWKGTDGNNLSGEATLIAGNTAQRDLIYFGFGIVKFLKWKLKGQVLFDYSYVPDGEGKLKYKLHIVVFPGGAVVNAIMNMGLFKKVVNMKIKEVFEHITDSAEELNDTSYDKILKVYKWTPAEKEKIKVLKSL